MNKAISTVTDIPADARKSAASPSGISFRRLGLGAGAALVLVAATYYGVKRWQFAAVHEDTDDAQVEGHVSPVLPRVSGYVTHVLVDDNQLVAAGQRVLEIDPHELDVKVAGAVAGLDSARADLATAQAALADARGTAAAAEAEVATAVVRQRKAAADLARDTQLFRNGAITESQLTDTQAAADTTAAQLAALRSRAAAAAFAIPVANARIAAARTHIAEKQSDLDYTRLQRSYADVTAPIAGIVSRKSVEPGQYLQAGQTILSVASATGLWVVANFKETQLTHLKAGQPVEFTVDSYPGVVFQGRVDSIGGATGARFALLPPDNSTGNFVKVTQRVPVKIILSQVPDADHPLRPGMSVDAAVRVRD